MLKTVESSRGKKTKGLAITYRSGTKNKHILTLTFGLRINTG